MMGSGKTYLGVGAKVILDQERESEEVLQKGLKMIHDYLYTKRQRRALMIVRIIGLIVLVGAVAILITDLGAK